MKQEGFLAYLTQKLEIIEKININTQTQCRFVHRREMRGLNRLLRERALLIDQLVTVNSKLVNERNWEQVDEIQTMVKVIEIKQKEVLDGCDQVLQEALAEHKKIAAELSNFKLMRQLKGRYVQQWTVMAAGQRFSAKG
ncbi:hypothetical protein [Sporomusa sp.]|uniref:hypothetical protein n=1 Tax=Sporomusa sp. TaxID=2078658 RepID=UPI002B5A3FDC|nr:hypothetical protein [Sporomusa sp.]HWR07942.1 hypothetical protein [Sporomusa sp.]